MSKKVKVLVSVLVMAVLLTIGGAATALAQEEPAQEEPTELELELAPCFRANGILAKVAEVLGITPEELIDIFKQAQQELREEAFIKYVEKAAEKGIISSEEAEEIIEWWKDSPEAVDCLFPWSHILPAIRSRHMRGDSGNVTGEVFITPGKAEQIKMRWQNRTRTLDHPVPQARIFKAVRSRQQIAVPEGWKGLRTPSLAD